MTNLTDLEQTVLLACRGFWNYGDETEKEDNAVMFNVRDLREVTGLPMNTIKGVAGSLFKKNLFCEMEGGPRGGTVEFGITEEGIDKVLELLKE